MKIGDVLDGIKESCAIHKKYESVRNLSESKLNIKYKYEILGNIIHLFYENEEQLFNFYFKIEMKIK